MVKTANLPCFFQLVDFNQHELHHYKLLFLFDLDDIIIPL